MWVVTGGMGEMNEYAQQFQMISRRSPKKTLLILCLIILPITAVFAQVVGDFTGDGEVHIDDFIAFARNYGKTSKDSSFDARFDLNGDGEVGFPDFVKFVSNFGVTQEDLREDPTYLQQQIKHISDGDLFAAMNLNQAGLEAVKMAVEAGNYPAAYTAWGEYWDSRPGFAYVNSGTPFFTVDKAMEIFPKGSYTASADRVVARDITGWGGVTIQHGHIVDFNADYGQSGKYGFHYWGWSRPLLYAYMQTRDTKYLDAFDELFNQWYEQRDDVVGGFSHLDSIWYELGLGSNRNRIFLEFYRLNRGRLSAKTHERMLKNYVGSARWLYELEDEGYRSGNWQVMGSYALAELGLNLREFKESEKWITLGTYRMEEHLTRDFHEDGCHSERCPSSYSTIVYRDPRNLAYLLEQFGGYEDKVAALQPPLERTLTHWMYLMSPLGTQPAVNDGGRGRFNSDFFVDGGRGFDRPDFLWLAKNLLGADIDDPMEEPAFTSMDFRPSGFAVMRQNWTKESPYLMINYGPWGGGHSHPDILSFELFAYGEAMAVDAGIGVSYDDPHHRPWYVTSKAHNMLVFDDAKLDRKDAVGVDPVWSSGDLLDYFSAEQRGYESSGIWHRRHFLFLKPEDSSPDANPYFLVFDAFSTVAMRRTASFMLHAPEPLLWGGPGQLYSKSPGLVVATPDPVAISRGMGMANLGGVSSPGRREIGWVSLEVKTTGGSQVDGLPVVLFPYVDEFDKSVTVRRGENAGPGGTLYLTVLHGEVTDHILISDGTLRSFGNGNLTTDAKCAVVRTRLDGTYISHSVAAGARLNYRGQKLIR
jgi:hypothetical protein